MLEVERSERVGRQAADTEQDTLKGFSDGIFNIL